MEQKRDPCRRLPGPGTSSMSLLLIALQPRIDEPSGGSILEQTLGQLTDRNRKMLPGTDQVDELHVHDPTLFFLQILIIPLRNVSSLLLSTADKNAFTPLSFAA